MGDDGGDDRYEASLGRWDRTFNELLQELWYALPTIVRRYHPPD